MTKPRGIPSLTGIRGIAAIWVMCFHSQQEAGPIFGLPILQRIPVINFGCHGVDLFFMLSGFVLMLAHAQDFVTFRKVSLIRFARLRFVRIYPLNTVVLLLIAIFVAIQPAYVAWARSAAGGESSAFSTSSFIATLFLANRWFLPVTGDWNQPVWSLSLELLGYMVFPVLAFCALRIVRKWQLISIGSLFLIAGYVVMNRFAFECEISQIAAVRMITCFVAGIVVFRLWKLTPAWGERWGSAVCAVSAIGILARGFPPFRTMVTSGDIQFNFFFASLIYGLAFQKGIVNAILGSRVAVFLGEISFPLYLVHVVPLLWLRYWVTTHGASEYSGQNAVALSIWATGCIALATMLHYFVERPFHSWGRRWAGARVSS